MTCLGTGAGKGFAGTGSGAAGFAGATLDADALFVAVDAAGIVTMRTEITSGRYIGSGLGAYAIANPTTMCSANDSAMPRTSPR